MSYKKSPHPRLTKAEADGILWWIICIVLAIVCYAMWPNSGVNP